MSQFTPPPSAAPSTAGVASAPARNMATQFGAFETIIRDMLEHAASPSTFAYRASHVSRIMRTLGTLHHIMQESQICGDLDSDPRNAFCAVASYMGIAFSILNVSAPLGGRADPRGLRDELISKSDFRLCVSWTIWIWGSAAVPSMDTFRRATTDRAFHQLFILNEALVRAGGSAHRGPLGILCRLFSTLCALLQPLNTIMGSTDIVPAVFGQFQQCWPNVRASIISINSTPELPAPPRQHDYQRQPSAQDQHPQQPFVHPQAGHTIVSSTTQTPLVALHPALRTAPAAPVSQRPTPPPLIQKQPPAPTSQLRTDRKAYRGHQATADQPAPFSPAGDQHRQQSEMLSARTPLTQVVTPPVSTFKPAPTASPPVVTGPSSLHASTLPLEITEKKPRESTTKQVTIIPLDNAKTSVSSMILTFVKLFPKKEFTTEIAFYRWLEACLVQVGLTFRFDQYIEFFARNKAEIRRCDPELGSLLFDAYEKELRNIQEGKPSSTGMQAKIYNGGSIPQPTGEVQQEHDQTSDSRGNLSVVARNPETAGSQVVKRNMLAREGYGGSQDSLEGSSTEPIDAQAPIPPSVTPVLCSTSAVKRKDRQNSLEALEEMITAAARAPSGNCSKRSRLLSPDDEEEQSLTNASGSSERAAPVTPLLKEEEDLKPVVVAIFEKVETPGLRRTPPADSKAGNGPMSGTKSFRRVGETAPDTAGAAGTMPVIGSENSANPWSIVADPCQGATREPPTENQAIHIPARSPENRIEVSAITRNTTLDSAARPPLTISPSLLGPPPPSNSLFEDIGTELDRESSTLSYKPGQSASPRSPLFRVSFPSIEPTFRSRKRSYTASSSLSTQTRSFPRGSISTREIIEITLPEDNTPEVEVPNDVEHPFKTLTELAHGTLEVGRNRLGKWRDLDPSVQRIALHRSLSGEDLILRYRGVETLPFIGKFKSCPELDAAEPFVVEKAILEAIVAKAGVTRALNGKYYFMVDRIFDRVSPHDYGNRLRVTDDYSIGRHFARPLILDLINWVFYRGRATDEERKAAEFLNFARLIIASSTKMELKRGIMSDDLVAKALGPKLNFLQGYGNYVHRSDIDGVGEKVALYWRPEEQLAWFGLEPRDPEESS